MKEAYVTFDTARFLKEKGFDWECLGFYKYYKSSPKAKPHLEMNISIYPSARENSVAPCPTQAVACRWLREEHEIDIIPVIQHRWRYSQESPFKEYSCRVYDSDGSIVLSATKWYSRYENAVEAALEFVLTKLI